MDLDYAIDLDPLFVREFFDSMSAYDPSIGQPSDCSSDQSALLWSADTGPGSQEEPQADWGSVPGEGAGGVGGYRPAETRGSGTAREGMCAICGKWYRLKTSNYWYHMNFTHGITSQGGAYPRPKVFLCKRGTCAVCPLCGAEILLGSGNRRACRLFNWYRHCQRGCRPPLK